MGRIRMESVRAAASAAFLGAFALSANGRARLPPNPIDPATRSSLTVQDVVVDWLVDDGAHERNAEYSANKAEMIRELASSVRDAFQYSPYGPNAVVLHVRIRSFKRYEVVGDVSVKRATDQAELGVYDNIDGFFIGVANGGGLVGALIGLASVPDPTPGAAICFAARLRARFNDLPRPSCT